PRGLRDSLSGRSSCTTSFGRGRWIFARSRTRRDKSRSATPVGQCLSSPGADEDERTSGRTAGMTEIAASATEFTDELGALGRGAIERRRYRAIGISDFLLGTKGCKARILLDFLRSTESQFLYLVGDIFDGQQLTRSWFWAQSHNDVIQKILRKARKGTE